MAKLITLKSIEELTTLRDLYRVDWPTNAVGYYTVDNFIKWFEKEPEIKYVHIFSVAERWRESGFYMILDRFQLFMNTLKADEDKTIAAQALKQLDWTRGYKISALPRRLFDAVTAALRELNFDWREVYMGCKWMPSEQASRMQVSCPEGFSKRSLTAADASIMNEIWHSRQTGTLQIIKRVIQHNSSVGIYALDTNELVAWIARCHSGLLAFLQVKDSFRRRGLAEAAARAFTQEVGKSGDDVLAFVRKNNVASNALFRKLGFETLAEDYNHLFVFRVPADDVWPFES